MADNKTTIWNYLKGKGLSNEAVAGIMGNIQQESNFDPTSTNSSSGAFGIFQWLGGRKTNLQKFAESQGKSATDLNVQLDFFWKEINGSEKATKEVIFANGKTAEQYAYDFEKSFERSGGSAVDKRQNYAKKILAEMMGKKGVDLAENVGNSTGEVLANADFSDDGFWTKLAKNIIIVILCGVFVILGILLLLGAFDVNPVSAITGKGGGGHD